MPPDIRAYVQRRLDQRTAAGVHGPGGVSDDVLRVEAARFRAVAGINLPETYVEICRINDAFADDGPCLYGIGTYYGSDRQFPAYEGLMEVHERHEFDIGPMQMVVFGDRDGTDPWGWHLVERCFVKGDPNYRDIMGRYDHFEDMFRGLFYVTENP
jgi:hypothetical protein